MILKILLIMAVMSYYTTTSKAFNAAIFWGVATLLLSLIFHGFSIGVILGSGLSFLIALGVFKLLEYAEGSGYYWPAYIGGIFVLVAVS
ncbi:hypothetical protein [Bacterioplanoides sp. SCSIO 12839]|uniref:hypothetical protein n=1 Tax=Bacterioplanoides sp. SCSIO 12839 TaxID=2829569 RepID=UPI00210411FF|nr:hypothetical protein [Bacterioplanoides sp. SCSIO 12839]UTW47060.1 hypothetical protein KFF03_10715 [Bacterioplanoides sp. SCSIO 12839]